jgi:hypothetical protein
MLNALFEPLTTKNTIPAITATKGPWITWNIFAFLGPSGYTD